MEAVERTPARNVGVPAGAGDHVDDDKLSEMRRQNQIVLYGLEDLPISGHPADAELAVLTDTVKRALAVDFAAVNVFTDGVQATLAASDAVVHEPVPRQQSVCGVTLARYGDVAIIEIPDVREDPELRELPVVAADRDAIRFYAAAPLVGRQGFTLGTLCVVSDRPRRLTPPERRLLVYLGYATVAILDGHQRRPPGDAPRARGS